MSKPFPYSALDIIESLCSSREIEFRAYGELFSNTELSDEEQLEAREVIVKKAEENNWSLDPYASFLAQCERIDAEGAMEYRGSHGGWADVPLLEPISPPHVAD